MAYAAITCLMRTINQSMELTGCDLQPFYAKLESLRAILDESCDVTGDLEALTRLEVEIAEVAYSAEDMVDSKSIKVSLAETAITRTRAFWKLCCSLEQGVERIDSIMKKWMAVRNWYRKIIDLKAQTFSLASTIPEHAVERPEHIMVGHENAFKMMQDQLTRGEREREVVSIVGMGGIGKTTLATKLYSDPFIMSHFDILAKATVSQEYCPRNVLLALLSSTSDEPYDQLADRLQKHLKGKRYLAVIDDIWTTGAWDDIQLCLPDCNNRSRILLTTRNGEVAEYASLEDELISAHKLVELWAVEGFLKVEETKNMEEVAKTCINELIDRSLISNGGKMTSYCKMHDLIRELCLKEARKMNFVNVLRGKSDQNSCAQSIQCSSKSRGRIGIHSEEELARCRSSEAHSIIMLGSFQCFALELPFKLVRVLDLASVDCEAFPSGILHLIHLRYLALCLYPLLKQYRSSEEEIPSSIIDVPSSIIDIPPSISSLCYLQTFILRTPFHFGYGEYPFILPSEILTMPQLRHLHLSWNYLRYYEPTEKSLVLKNLQCLSGWNPFNCTGSAFGLFPNLKKLQISGDPKDFLIRKDQYDFRYLHQLEELEFILSNKAAKCFLERITPSDSTLETPLMLQRIIKQPKLGLSFPPPPDAFPQNLKNLTLKGLFFLLWKDLSIVGKLPKLESLQLINCRGGWEWEVAEEGFLRLKFLLLNQLDILYWSASSDHFPCLERLFLYGCINLDSIPQEFVDITTLTLIDIDRCRKSVGNSAKQIQQDIQDVYGGSIDVHIHRPLSW
ncbi:putative late blight resistance protein homolog R1B-13 isoform X2 [Lycium barbarum]|uniref:putative late blight resistance protein homolog R1B-13 isoform X2 n=1 Tax=Lycium barbarum TaxID=112863 RepID=UPI00293E68DE|nr:putative late blight resistance protein homolog R1B-13 isoform X2 [Lycium barbarum]